MKEITYSQRIKSDMLKQASFINLLICGFRKLLGKENNDKRFHYPKNIGQYKLLSKIDKINNFKNYGIAIYRDKKGKKVFVKTWRGKTKFFTYYSLINEYNTAKILSEKFKLVVKNSKFRIPKPIGYLKTQNTFSILLEYVDGKLLSEYSVEKQAKVINDVVLLFYKVGSLLGDEDKKYIKKRDRLFHLLSLPLIFLYAFILEKESKRVIFYSFLRTYFKTTSLLNSKLTLAHGDLNPDNILISGSHFHILDLEHLKYTVCNYDLSYLLVGTGRDSQLLNILKNRKYITHNIFLSLYIALQFSIYTDPKTKQRPFFDYLKNYEK